MTDSQFHLANLEWARGILAQPSYVMPNGRDSHEVVNEVADEAQDNLIDHARYTADGRVRYV
jgi:hypothetical protein